MAADLFESFEATLVAAIVLGLAAFPDRPEVGLLFPLAVQAIGIVSSIVGIYLVRPRSERESGITAINRGFFAAAVVSLVLVGSGSIRDRRLPDGRSGPPVVLLGQGIVAAFGRYSSQTWPTIPQQYPGLKVAGGRTTRGQGMARPTERSAEPTNGSGLRSRRAPTAPPASARRR